MAMSNFEEMRRVLRADGPATILAIGTANPEKYILQADFPDWFFRVTNSEHKTDLKNRFKKLCDRTMIEKRHFYLTEEILKENPNIGTYMGTSLDARQDMLIAEVPKLGKAAALAAIKEWDRPMSEITHLIFNSTGGVDMPGADYRLIKLLGLSPSVKRIMMYQQGCFMGTTVLRIAKDIAENNRGARVLVVCSEITLPNFRGLPEDDVMVDQPLPNGNGPEMFVEMEKNTDHVSFQGPSKAQLDTMIGQALFGDGAAALIIGADPDLSVEKPLFQIVHATQNILHDSEGYIEGHLREAGLTSQVKNVPKILANNIEKGMIDTLGPFGIEDWNSLFWITHPGGPAILDKVEQTLGLHEDRMKAAREVLKEYGNMWSASVLFIMDKMRKMSTKEGKKTTGEGMEWGVVVGFGAGVTVETVVLKAVRI